MVDSIVEGFMSEMWIEFDGVSCSPWLIWMSDDGAIVVVSGGHGVLLLLSLFASSVIVFVVYSSSCFCSIHLKDEMVNRGNAMRKCDDGARML